MLRPSLAMLLLLIPFVSQVCADRPNVLLILTDDMDDRVSCQQRENRVLGSIPWQFAVLPRRIKGIEFSGINDCFVGLTTVGYMAMFLYC